MSEARKIFNQLDVDKSGVLNGDEMKELCNWAFKQIEVDGKPYEPDVIERESKQ